MKIPQKIHESYLSLCVGSSVRDRDAADALQWVVAEAMKFEHQVFCRAWYYPDEHCAGGICFKTDEELLAEADRELRREDS